MGDMKLLFVNGRHGIAMDELPTCYFCDNRAVYDMRMAHRHGGQWAMMCETCEERYGIHILGLGFGQKLFIKGDESSIGTKR